MNVTLHGSCAVLNLLIGAAILLGVVIAAAGGSSGVREMWVYAFVGVLCMSVGGFLLASFPGAVTLLAAPIALFSGVLVFLLAAGGREWGATDEGNVAAVTAGSAVLLLVEVVSIAAAWRARVAARRK